MKTTASQGISSWLLKWIARAASKDQGASPMRSDGARKDSASQTQPLNSTLIDRSIASVLALNRRPWAKSHRPNGAMESWRAGLSQPGNLQTKIQDFGVPTIKGNQQLGDGTWIQKWAFGCPQSEAGRLTEATRLIYSELSSAFNLKLSGSTCLHLAGMVLRPECKPAFWRQGGDGAYAKLPRQTLLQNLYGRIQAPLLPDWICFHTDASLGGDNTSFFVQLILFSCFYIFSNKRGHIGLAFL